MESLPIQLVWDFLGRKPAQPASQEPMQDGETLCPVSVFTFFFTRNLRGAILDSRGVSLFGKVRLMHPL